MSSIGASARSRGRVTTPRSDGLTAPGTTEPLVERTDSSLFVVTAADGAGEQAGCLAEFVTQCSIDPVRFLVCLSHANRTFDVAGRADGIALHLLGEEQTDMASLFGETTGDEVDKFARCRWRTGDTGAPVLTDCAAWIEGPVHTRLDVGDHDALLMTPTAGGPGPCAGVLTARATRPLQPGHPADDERPGTPSAG